MRLLEYFVLLAQAYPVRDLELERLHVVEPCTCASWDVHQGFCTRLVGTFAWGPALARRKKAACVIFRECSHARSCQAVTSSHKRHQSTVLQYVSALHGRAGSRERARGEEMLCGRSVGGVMPSWWAGLVFTSARDAPPRSFPPKNTHTATHKRQATTATHTGRTLTDSFLLSFFVSLHLSILLSFCHFRAQRE